jgi:hypothetical protein
MRTSRSIVLLCGLAASGCAMLDEAHAPPADDNLGEAESPVVYGTDNRTDVYAHADATLHDHLIQVMDVVRSAPNPDAEEGDTRRIALFTDISIGDAP